MHWKCFLLLGSALLLPFSSSWWLSAEQFFFCLFLVIIFHKSHVVVRHQGQVLMLLKELWPQRDYSYRNDLLQIIHKVSELQEIDLLCKEPILKFCLSIWNLCASYTSACTDRIH